jgi:hypothetical protein
MPDKSEAARIEAEVQKRLASIMTEQQQQWAAAMEAMMKNSLGGIDQANAALAGEQKKLELELDRAQELRRKAESEGEKMATEAYEKHRAQYDESAKIKVLRDLTRQHIEAGKPDERNHGLARRGSKFFVENIRVVVQRVQKFRAKKIQAKRVVLPGRPENQISGLWPRRHRVF